MHRPQRKCLLNLGVYVKRPGTLRGRAVHADDVPVLRGFRQRYAHRVYRKSPSTGTIRSCAACLVALLAAFAPGCTSIEAVPVRQSEPGSFLLLPMEVNGIPATFLFDTGTNHTVISKEFADRFGIRANCFKRDIQTDVSVPGGTREAHCVELKSARMGPIRAKRNPGQALIVDLPHLRAIYGEDVAGVLGNATWFSADYVLDVERPSLVMSRRLGLSESSEAHRLKVSGGETFIPVEIDGRRFDFLLATGSGATRVTQEVIDALRPVNYDYVELEVTTMGSTEYKKLPVLHAAVKVGNVEIPQFTFLVGKENVIGLSLLRYGELSVSMRDEMFIFRRREGS